MMDSNKPQERILVVDDEPNLLSCFKELLEQQGYEVESALTAEEALSRLEKKWFDLIISDLRLSSMDGLEFIKKAQLLCPSIPVVFLTAHGILDSALQATKEAAYDYLKKPASKEEIKLAVARALEHHRLTREVERLRAEIETGRELSNIIGRSKPMRTLFRLVRVVAKSHATVLIQGESGTGKELFARAVHHYSPRRERPFVAIDCSALPETLLESELFGHARGAFTGAVSNKKGLFEEAHGGTLLLDEIGETTTLFQSKLLRVLQEGEVRSLGSNRVIKIDVRVIASTNKDLKKEVEKKHFREDLYYRLAVIPLCIPALRDRKEDIPLLVDHFIAKYCKENGLPLKSISAEALKLLMSQNWPGNVRELENVIERAVVITPDPEIGPTVLLPTIGAEETAPTPLHEATKDAQKIVETQQIARALQKAHGNRSVAARLLGISRTGLYKKLRNYNLFN